MNRAPASLRASVGQPRTSGWSALEMPAAGLGGSVASDLRGAGTQGSGGRFTQINAFIVGCFAPSVAVAAMAFGLVSVPTVEGPQRLEVSTPAASAPARPVVDQPASVGGPLGREESGVAPTVPPSPTPTAVSLPLGTTVRAWTYGDFAAVAPWPAHLQPLAVRIQWCESNRDGMTADPDAVTGKSAAEVGRFQVTPANVARFPQYDPRTPRGNGAIAWELYREAEGYWGDGTHPWVSTRGCWSR